MATKHLSFNRGDFKDTDPADLLVSRCVATFRAIGTEVEVPVEGIRVGTVRLPLKQLNDLMSVAKSYKKRDILLHFEPGMARVESWIRRHPDISLGIFPDRTLDLPADAGVLDTLAIGRLISPEEILNQGLRERLEAAQRRTSDAVSRASDALADLGVARERIQELVDDRVRETSEKLRSVLHVHFSPLRTAPVRGVRPE